jgi:hypothetical protein
MPDPVYAHRPSKDVTRRIFVDMLRHLNRALNVREFQYVGFGALEFIDFDLMHRNLGITKLTSIENSSNIERYEANKPYRNIELLAGHSTDMLTRINWTGLSVVWLDYECPLQSIVFNDIEYLCTKLTPGSVLAVTLNAEPGRLDGRRDRFAKNVTEARVPQGVDDDILGSWGWAEAQQRILFSILRNRLSKRVDQASWKQVLNIQYRDNAKMQFTAGVVGTPALAAALEMCELSKLDYYRGSADALRIEIPYFTSHEQSLLRRKLPRGSHQRLSLPGVDATDVGNYANFYKWIGA